MCIITVQCLLARSIIDLEDAAECSSSCWVMRCCSCNYLKVLWTRAYCYLIVTIALIDLTVIYLLPKVCSVKKDTKLNQVFCIIKSWEIISISLPEFYLIIWLMTSPKNFEKIPILKTWQLVFFWGIKTYFGILPQKWCMKNKYFKQ